MVSSALVAGTLEKAQRALQDGDYVTAMDLARPLADRGNAKAQSLVGQMYEQGFGTVRDPDRASRWYRKAAVQGDTAAELALGSLYLIGKAVPKDVPEGVRWIEKAAEGGNVQAMTSLAFLYRGGGPVAPDALQEWRWALKAARKGDATSRYTVCSVYLAGQLGQPQNPSQAYRWCRLAAAQGIFDAELTLGDLFAAGEGVSRDKRQAAQWYHQAAAMPPPVAGAFGNQRWVDSIQDSRQKRVSAAIGRLDSDQPPLLPPLVDSRKLRSQAEHGNPQAQNDLAGLYSHGTGGVLPDAAQAASWYRKAADQQFGLASYNLAILYLQGRGVPKDEQQFFGWLQKSAQQGFALAQLALAREYLSGRHAPKDPEQALVWFRKAAEQGDGQAEFALGVMYEEGEGVPRDLAQASAWYQKAAAQGGFAQEDARHALLRIQGIAKP
ncbi:MAG TPA: tetratricopeptide repeat protein [Steroidobacteraceae bacterium]|nr:tetratricopeptide repeat protein [Steroidobacteraceae bacterium]